MATNRKPITKLSSTVFPYRGKYRIQYFDAQGKIRTKTAATLKDAYKQLALLEQQVKLGTHPIRGADLPTLSEWLDSWYESRKNEVSPTTLWNFESTIRLHIKPELGEFRLDKLTGAQVEQHYRNLQEHKALSPGSIYKVHATLNHAIRAAVKGGLIIQSPMFGIKAPRQGKRHVETLTFEEVQSLLNASRDLGAEAVTRWLLALRLGLRQGECLALTWGDIDLDRGIVKVSKTVNSIPGQGIVFMSPKSLQSNRTVPCDSETHEALKSLARATGGSDASSLLFPGKDGTPRDASVDYRNWIRLLSLAQVRRVRLHDARHAAATLMLANGADIRSIQIILGHATPSFTMATYLHPNTESLRKAIEQAGRNATHTTRQ